PILGYIGSIHRWVDQQLLIEVARRRRDWTIALIGPRRVDTTQLERESNIIIVPAQKHEDLPYFLREFSVGLIPYVLDAFAQSLRPTKVLEYLAMGLDVVATDLPELRPWSAWIRTAPRERFALAIAEALSADNSGRRG